MCVSKLLGCPDISHLVVGATRYAIPHHNLIKILALLCEFLHSTTTYKSVLEPKSVNLVLTIADLTALPTSQTKLPYSVAKKISLYNPIVCNGPVPYVGSIGRRC